MALARLRRDCVRYVEQCVDANPGRLYLFDMTAVNATSSRRLQNLLVHDDPPMKSTSVLIAGW